MGAMQRPIACVCAAAALAAVLAALALSVAAGAPDEVEGVSAFLLVICVATPAAVGLFVVMSRPGNRVGWILLVGPLSVAVVMAADAGARLALDGDPASTVGTW